MAFAVNILALLLVVGLCWAAMIWVSGRFHGHGHGHSEVFVIDDLARRDFTADSISTAVTPCALCEGVGASHRRGRLEPCPQCEGTGVLH